MEGETTKSGIEAVGHIPWGTHLCLFYQSKEDLIEILAPYLKAGLESNQFCMWVTSEPLGENEAKEAMRKVAPNLDRHLERGQMEIVPHSEWYLKDGVFDMRRVLNAWIDKLEHALANGYDGIRVTGDAGWLGKRDWKNYGEYEEEVNNVISKYRMLAICTYPLDKCGASEIIDVVANHQFALVRRGAGWELIKSSGRKQAEEREKRLQQELILNGRLASIGRMASGMAHEMNNPLTGVIGFAQLLMKKDIPDDVRRDLQMIHSEAQRAAKVVEGLLTFARRRKSVREYIDINEIISGVVELRSYEMRVNNIQVVSQLVPDLPRTVADAAQIQQVFLNIILNAEKEMIGAHGKGRLLIKTEKAGDIIRACFTDDGPGISEENLDKVFDPFFTTREVGNGTGLGLSICHGIVTQHNGRIYARSKPGEGATFVVELPIVSSARKTQNSRAVEEEVWQHNGAKILVVDDEPVVLDFIRCLLTDQGYEVDTADTAGVALERIHGGQYNLILLDIKLPVMNGIELYHHIEALDPALADKVMFITGDVMESTTRDFLNKTKVPYITKPFDIERLEEGIKSLLTKGL